MTFAGVDRDLFARDQADAPTEEGRRQVLVETEPEVEDVGALEKEGALLGKEQREARQVHAARVDFGLGEIGVDGERRQRVRAEALRDVEAGMSFAFATAMRRRCPALRRRRRTAERSSPIPSANGGSPVSSPARLVCVTL